MLAITAWPHLTHTTLHVSRLRFLPWTAADVSTNALRAIFLTTYTSQRTVNLATELTVRSTHWTTLTWKSNPPLYVRMVCFKKIRLQQTSNDSQQLLCLEYCTLRHCYDCNKRYAGHIVFTYSISISIKSCSRNVYLDQSCPSAMSLESTVYIWIKNRQFIRSKPAYETSTNRGSIWIFIG